MKSRSQLPDPIKFVSWVGNIGDSAWYRWGWFLVIGALLVLDLTLFLRTPAGYSGDRYSGLLVVTMLLLNHLWTSFARSTRMKWALGTVAVLWTAFTSIYVVYQLGKY